MSDSTLAADSAAVTLARESRGMRQGELAAKMSQVLGVPVSQSYVSKAEAGRVIVTGDRLEALAEVLGYPCEALCTKPAVDGVGIGLVHHRKKASLGAPALRQIHAELEFARRQVKALVEAAGGRTHSFTRKVLAHTDFPREKASEVRAEWGVPPGPITDLVALIERAGGFVLVRNLGTAEIDAVSQWFNGGAPLLLLNSLAPADRFRFSMAHELGHMLMHPDPGSTPEQEREADEFASELLMPATDIRGEMRGIDIPRLSELKTRWGASMAALIRRGFDLGELTEWQYRNLMIEMSVLGYRTKEPVTIRQERPSAVARIVAKLMEQGQSPEQLAATAGMLPDEFHQRYIRH